MIWFSLLHPTSLLRFFSIMEFQMVYLQASQKEKKTVHCQGFFKFYFELDKLSSDEVY